MFARTLRRLYQVPLLCHERNDPFVVLCTLVNHAPITCSVDYLSCQCQRPSSALVILSTNQRCRVCPMASFPAVILHCNQQISDLYSWQQYIPASQSANSNIPSQHMSTQGQSRMCWSFAITCATPLSTHAYCMSDWFLVLCNGLITTDKVGDMGPEILEDVYAEHGTHVKLYEAGCARVHFAYLRVNFRQAFDHAQMRVFCSSKEGPTFHRHCTST
ncbi:hypothetical protein K474DRAFT_1048446 [Panus rudis PR-1116 ss-1]|nr:hypothetical protein K474DRAFT_1048446 [Panus rudis PR-1116 ss-1]